MQISASKIFDKVTGIAKPQPSLLNPGSDTSGNIPKIRVRDPVQRAKAQARLESSMAMQGGMTGMTSGLMTGFPLGAVPASLTGGISGLMGGVVGAKVGFKTQSTGKAVLAGAATGVAVGTATHLGLSLLMQSLAPTLARTGIQALVPMSTDLATTTAIALLSGMNGVVGTMAASHRAAPKDAAYGGWGAGVIATRMTGNPMMMAAGSAAGSLAGYGKTAVGRGILGVGAGAAMGALTSVPYFIAGNPAATALLTSGAVSGAIVGGAGAVIGPVARQIIRNVTDHGVGKFNQKVVDPFLEKHELGKGGTMAAGALLGALTVGSFGTLAPTLGLPLLPSVGVLATLGAGKMMWKVHDSLTTKERLKEIQKPETIEQLNKLAAMYKGTGETLQAIKRSS